MQKREIFALLLPPNQYIAFKKPGINRPLTGRCVCLAKLAIDKYHSFSGNPKNWHGKNCILLVG